MNHWNNLNYWDVYDFNCLPYFFLYMFLIRIMFFVLHLYLSYKEINFNKLTTNKKQYVVKNIVKSINLCGLTLFCVPYIIYPAIYEIWDNRLIHLCGLFYGSNDCFALLFVNDLPQTTKNHHRITTVLSIINLGINYKNSSVGRMMFVYSLASSSAYLVNYFLGIRFLYKKHSLTHIKKKIRNIYAMSLLVNWGWHIYWTIKYLHLLEIQHFLYFILLFWIVKDDIILFSWLCN